MLYHEKSGNPDRGIGSICSVAMIRNVRKMFQIEQEVRNGSEVEHDNDAGDSTGTPTFHQTQEASF
jgi:hypothetical protein